MNILFDIDDTLYDQKERFMQAWTSVFNNTDEALAEKVFIRSRALSGKAFLAIRRGTLSADEMYVYRITEAMSENGCCISRAQGEAFQTAYLKAQSEITLSDTIKNMLSVLKAGGHRLGILSNGDSAFQRKKIKQLGLEAWFDADDIFISEEIGFEKPDDRAFQAVIRHWGVSEDQIIFVGDTYDQDIVGAVSSGLKTVWMNRRNAPIPEKQLFLPDVVVADEAALSAHLLTAAKNK